MNMNMDFDIEAIIKKAFNIKLIVRKLTLGRIGEVAQPNSVETNYEIHSYPAFARAYDINAPLGDLFKMAKVGNITESCSAELERVDTVLTYHNCDRSKIGKLGYEGFYDSKIIGFLKQIPEKIGKKKIVGFELVDYITMSECEKLLHLYGNKETEYAIGARLYAVAEKAKLPSKIKNQEVIYNGQVITKANLKNFDFENSENM